MAACPLLVMHAQGIAFQQRWLPVDLLSDNIEARLLPKGLHAKDPKLLIAQKLFRHETLLMVGSCLKLLMAASAACAGRRPNFEQAPT